MMIELYWSFVLIVYLFGNCFLFVYSLSWCYNSRYCAWMTILTFLLLDTMTMTRFGFRLKTIVIIIFGSKFWVCISKNSVSTRFRWSLFNWLIFIWFPYENPFICVIQIYLNIVCVSIFGEEEGENNKWENRFNSRDLLYQGFY